MGEAATWVPIPAGSDFTVANLPYGVAGDRVVVALGDHAVDLAEAADHGLLAGLDLPTNVFRSSSLNLLLALGPSAWRALRGRLADLLAEGNGELRDAPMRDRVVVPRSDLALTVPVEVGDYVDGYAGIHHATALGQILRPGSEPLSANWRRLPVAYHGRAGTIVVSGAEIARPRGQYLHDGEVIFGPSAMLDIELELGAVIGPPSERGHPIPIESAANHIFGCVLVNDWSARDIQSFEYQPLGPFLGKSFATSISPWVVPIDALAPFLVRGMTAAQEPPPAPYLATDRAWIPDARLEVLIETAAMREAGMDAAVVATVDVASALYWSMAQQLAHVTVNGASVRSGDLIASGTLSGPDRRSQAGSLIEATWRGAEPLVLPTGEERSFLADGDRVRFRGGCGAGAARVGFGEVEGMIVEAPGGD